MLVAVGAGCADRRPAPEPETTFTAEQEEQARSLFAAQDCNMCHGDDAEGAEIGPALRDMAEYWSVERLVVFPCRERSASKRRAGIVAG